ncbi:MAG TPA: hypothetical protein VFA33_20085 [Bryobacteraceae bacterium]|nr:hypothetical protein [Bryobacteraceae bacterium]
MKTTTALAAIVFLGGTAGALAQQAPPAPIYRVTVEQRTIQAVNYGHRTAPTKIGFQGTVLMPKAAGEAVVHSRRGAVSIDARFEHLEEPVRFGAQYLTYVLWAVTPDGRVTNLGEVVTDAHEKAHLAVTTQLQAFALILTAEPYYAVTRPSDVVVMQNQILPDTTGRIETVNAKYELMPRTDYTYHVNQADEIAAASRRKVSVEEANAITALYQAQNALQIAKSKGADRYAPDVFQKAQNLLTQAQAYRDRKSNARQVITLAREATQTAQDALMIAGRHNPEEVAKNAADPRP